MEDHQTSPFNRPSHLFTGIRFVLFGYDPINKSQVSRKLVSEGAIDAGGYSPNVTHVIVHRITYDDLVCVAARRDGKILVSSLWVDHCFDMGGPVDPKSVMYTPVRDLNGIPGAKSLVICLTGYQRDDREDIMTMVDLMGAHFSKPLIGEKVTHLICYKFEGDKFLLAKKMRRIKIINHKWLEDSLEHWEILSEAGYSKSGYELELEVAEAKDSEEEAEGATTRYNERKTASPHHSLFLKQEVPRSISTTSASRGFGNAENVVSASMKTTSDEFSNPYEIRSSYPGTGSVFGDTSGPSNLFEGTSSGSAMQNNIIAASKVANISPSTETRKATFASYLREVLTGTTPPKIVPTSNTSSAKRLSKLNLSEASLLEKVNDESEIALAGVRTSYNSLAFCPEDEQNASSYGKRKMDNSYGSSKIQRITRSNDNNDTLNRESPLVESAFQELKNNAPATISSLNDKAAISPAQNTSSKITGRKSPRSKGRNAICDVPVSKTSTIEIVQDEDLDAMQRPVKEYRGTSLATNFDNSDVGLLGSVKQSLEKSSSSAVSSDLQKSTQNLEINDRSAGSNSKPVKRKSTGKKFSAPNQTLGQKKTVNEKGSIYLSSSQQKSDATTSASDENLSKYKMFEVHPEAISGMELVMDVIDGFQVENMSGNKSCFMDDETEPPEEEINVEPENTVDIVMEEKVERNPLNIGQNNDKDGGITDLGNLMSIANKVLVDKSDYTENLASDKTASRRKKQSLTKIGKRKEITEKKATKKKEHASDNSNDKTESTEEVTPHQAGKTIRNVNELENTMELKRAEGVTHDSEHKNNEKAYEVTEMDADVDTENVVNKKEPKRTKSSPSKTKKDAALFAKKVTLTKSVNKQAKPTSSLLVKVCNLEKQQENMQILDDDPEHDNDKKADDGTDNVADGEIENGVNKKETKINKRSLNKTSKDAPLSVQEANDTKATKKGKPTSSRSDKARIWEAQKKIQSTAAVNNDFEQKNNEKDDNGTDKNTDSVVNKETKKDKHPSSKTKKDAALSVKEVTDTKAVKKKGNPTSSRSVKAYDLEAQKENMQISDDDQITDNKQVFKSATEVPEKITPTSDKANSDPKWFILTGHKLQRKEFQQIIRRLKGRICRVSHQWSYQATHFIVPDPIRRTEKFFAAAASGRWIMKTDYLSASNQAGRFLEEEPYEWHKNGLSEDGQINLEAPRKWRLLKEKTGYGAFYGMRIIIYGECIAPPLDTLKRAVKAGDGTILATSPPYTRFLNTGIDFAVVSPGMPHVDIWVQEFLRHEIPCISADYLVEHVCKPGYPLEGHVQYDTNVWAERSYNNLKKRLEDVEIISGPRTPDSNDVACEVCGLQDRGEEMLICGDESGSIGCGVGTHIDCCDPPLDDIPEDDWFCLKCIKVMNCKTKKSSKRKGK